MQAKLKPFPHQTRNVIEWLGTDPYMAGRRDGKTDIGALAAGQSSALIHEVKPAGDIVRDIMAEASTGAGASERTGKRGSIEPGCDLGKKKAPHYEGGAENCHVKT